jgi:hypothetical protein
MISETRGKRGFLIPPVENCCRRAADADHAVARSDLLNILGGGVPEISLDLAISQQVHGGNAYHRLSQDQWSRVNVWI